MDERGNGRGLGVAVAHESQALTGLIDSGLESPTLDRRITKFGYEPGMDSGAAAVPCQSYKTGMSDIPSTL
jgi:hypothetical protein